MGNWGYNSHLQLVGAHLVPPHVWSPKVREKLRCDFQGIWVNPCHSKNEGVTFSYTPCKWTASRNPCKMMGWKSTFHLGCSLFRDELLNFGGVVLLACIYLSIKTLSSKMVTPFCDSLLSSVGKMIIQNAHLLTSTRAALSFNFNLFGRTSCFETTRSSETKICLRSPDT